MKTIYKLALITLFVLGSNIAAFAEEASEQAALASAKKWLEVVDAGDYEKSWALSAGIFKMAVGQEQWNRSVTAVRKPLGAVVSRSLKSKDYTKTLPGAPDGEYVVIQYSTSFKNKKTAVETVTPLLDADGTWRVSGYFIR